MKSADLVVFLGLHSSDWEDIQLLMEELDRDRFQHNFRSPTVTPTERVSLISVDKHIAAVGLALSLGRSGDLDQLVRVREVWRLEVPVPVNMIANAMPNSTANHFREKERTDGALPPQTTTDFFEVLPEFEELREAISQVTRKQRRPQATPQGASLAEQRDALALGLRLAGLAPSGLLAEPDQDSVSYMRLASRVPITEASSIRHDWSHLPGWETVASHFDQKTFADPTSGRRVSIYYADREGLEETTGTDLIYFRERPPGFVMVQYKRMSASELDVDDSERFYRPDSQLHKQMKTMNSIGWSEDSTSLDDWRLNSCPFYFKFVNEYAMAKPNEELVRGMYMSLPLLENSLTSPSTLGPHGGRRIGWAGARYLTNTEFLALTTNGWIGSSGSATAALTHLIAESIGDDRLVLVARESPMN